MSLAADLREITCPSCGAGLQVLGGGRVTTHVCGYCGSALDAIEGYRILQKFTSLHRPESPFRIGAEGTLFGATFRVIGTLGWEEAGPGGWGRWVDHMLFSPTHGYAWLTVEDGHLVFTRRLRERTSPSWISSAEVEAAETRPTAFVNGETYTYYETSTARITFAEGEFTWRPMVGDSTVTVSVLAEHSMLGFAESTNEREIERSVYLPGPETFAAFGIAAAPAPSGVHPLQPWRGGGNDSFVVKAGLGFAAVCTVMGLWFLGSGQVVLPARTIQAAELPVTVPVEITVPGRLATVTVGGKVDNSWAFVELTLNDPEDAPVFIAGREIDHYSGYDSDGSWTEDHRTTSLTFLPESAGTYTLEIDVPEAGEGESSGGGAKPAITVSAVEGVGNSLWMFGAALIFGGLAAWKASGPFLHRRARWKGTDWVEEDDDDDDGD